MRDAERDTESEPRGTGRGGRAAVFCFSAPRPDSPAQSAHAPHRYIERGYQRLRIRSLRRRIQPNARKSRPPLEAQRNVLLVNNTMPPVPATLEAASRVSDEVTASQNESAF
eukprot:7010507-Pyramimonas_sp.AAC.1